MGVILKLLENHTLATILSHVIPRGGESTVGSDAEVESDLDLLFILDLKPCLLGFEVCADKLVVEKQLDVGHCF